jgi:hypothetical protein
VTIIQILLFTQHNGLIEKAEAGMIEFCSRNVRELRGAPLSIVVLLMMTPIPVTKEWLARSSGYTDKPVAKACSYLKEHGWIDRSSAGWFLSTGYPQSYPQPLPGRNNSDSGDGEEQIIDDEEIHQPLPGRNNSESENVEEQNLVADEVEQPLPSRNYSDSEVVDEQIFDVEKSESYLPGRNNSEFEELEGHINDRDMAPTDFETVQGEQGSNQSYPEKRIKPVVSRNFSDQWSIIIIIKDSQDLKELNDLKYLKELNNNNKNNKNAGRKNSDSDPSEIKNYPLVLDNILANIIHTEVQLACIIRNNSP